MQRKAAEGTAEEVRERPLEFYLPLIGTRHIDPYNVFSMRPLT